MSVTHTEIEVVTSVKPYKLNLAIVANMSDYDFARFCEGSVDPVVRELAARLLAWCDDDECEDRLINNHQAQAHCDVR